MVAILALLGTSSIMTSNSVFSTTAAGPSAAPAPGPATATAAGAKAAAETPSSSWSRSTRPRASSRVRVLIWLVSSSILGDEAAAAAAAAERGLPEVKRGKLGVWGGNFRVWEGKGDGCARLEEESVG